jgi:hypothetical protein
VAKIHGGERYGKGEVDLVRYVPMETNTSEPPFRCRKLKGVIKTGAPTSLRDKPGRYLLTAQTVTGIKAA